MATPTVRKLQLGIELRRMREAAGLTPKEAATALDCALGKITRLELGQSGITMGDLKLLLDLYQVESEQAEWMVELSRENRRRGRWQGHRSAFPEWFRVFVDLERDADEIRIVEAEIIPGLLQTEAYMRALFTAASHYGASPDVEALTQARLERQEVLRRADPPTVSCVLSESCVRRMVGGPAVMAEQVRHLIELSAMPRIQLQLWPFDGELRTGILTARYAMLRIPAARAAQPFGFAYCEDIDDARYIDDPNAVRRYETEWSAAQAAALGPEDTRRRLREIARQLT